MWCHWEGVGAWCGPLVNGPRMGRRGESQVSKTMTRRRVRTQKRLRGPWMGREGVDRPPAIRFVTMLGFHITEPAESLVSLWG